MKMTLRAYGNKPKDLENTVVKIGSDPGNDIHLPPTSNVKAFHAEVRPVPIPNSQERLYEVVDLGNPHPNGTRINKQLLQPNAHVPLRVGDQIEIGNETILCEETPQPVAMNPSTASTKSPNPPVGGFFGFLVIVALIGGGIWYYQNYAQPGQTLLAYCSALKSGDYSTAYNLLSSSVQKKETKQQFVAPFNKHGGLKDCNVGEVSQQDSARTAVVTYSFKDGQTLNQTAVLVDENSNWKISSLKP